MPEKTEADSADGDQGSTETPRVHPTDSQANDIELKLVQRAARGDGRRSMPWSMLTRDACTAWRPHWSGRNPRGRRFAGSIRRSVPRISAGLKAAHRSKPGSRGFWWRCRPRSGGGIGKEETCRFRFRRGQPIGYGQPLGRSENRLHAALQKLSEEHREVLVLRELKECPTRRSPRRSTCHGEQSNQDCTGLGRN